MDFWESLRELSQERDRLDMVIRNLETLAGGKEPRALRRRGRKSMSAEERAEVAERMRKYWAGRRRGETGS